MVPHSPSVEFIQQSKVFRPSLNKTGLIMMRSQPNCFVVVVVVVVDVIFVVVVVLNVDVVV